MNSAPEGRGVFHNTGSQILIENYKLKAGKSPMAKHQILF